MRFWTLAAALLVLGLSSGCFVLEELDAGAGKKAAPKTGSSQDSTATPESPKPAGWGDVRTLSRDGLSQDIVRCELGGTVQFMRESDCAGRGGHVRR